MARTHSYSACRLVFDIHAAQIDLANLPLPPIDIRDVLDVAAPDMSGINLRNLLLNRGDEGTSKNVPDSSQLIQRKRARGESSAGPSCPVIPTPPPNPLVQETPGADYHFTQLGNVVQPEMLLWSGSQTWGDSSVPLWAPQLEYCGGGDAITEADCILLVGDGRNVAMASEISQAARLPLDMGEWKKSSDDELIKNLRRGLLMVSMLLFVYVSLCIFCFS